MRTQSTRLLSGPRVPTPVVSRFTKLQLELRARLTKTTRNYAAEREFFESLIALQSDSEDWWKKFSEEIANGRAEVEAAFRSIRKVLLQLDSSTKRAEKELSTLISTAEVRILYVIFEVVKLPDQS
ncbi:unnamed protein product [Dibothriocephalus latus]|uniref:Uncharacterized protein n=1 Tax=Dibothriocephalus latus TaxID=60516 RepID=A0A3P7NV17_DIBLA|nr:unnamed protein product [Dibothriocephalus latus]